MGDISLGGTKRMKMNIINIDSLPMINKYPKQ